MLKLGDLSRFDLLKLYNYILFKRYTRADVGDCCNV